MVRTEATRAVRLTAYTIVIVTVYGMLCVGDYALKKNEERWLRKLMSEPASIEKRRVQEQDKAMIADAKAHGYKSILYPGYFDSGIFRDTAEQAGIAPLAPQPDMSLYLCNEGYGLVRYRSDRFGFRNDDRVWDAQQIDIVLIGDSFAHGVCVDEAGSIAGFLSRTFGTVVNLASSDNGPVNYAALAKTFLPVLPATYAIVVFYSNDNQDEETSIFRKYFIDGQVDYFARGTDGRPVKHPSQKLKEFYSAAQALVDRGPDPDEDFEAWAERMMSQVGEPDSIFIRASRYLKLPNIRRVIGTALSIKVRRLPWSSRLAIDIVSEECRRLGCSPVFVYIPNSEFWSPDAYAREYCAALGEYVNNGGGRGQFIDTSDEIAKYGRAAYAPAGIHLSPLGYRLVVEKILHRLST